MNKWPVLLMFTGLLVIVLMQNHIVGELIKRVTKLETTNQCEPVTPRVYSSNTGKTELLGE